MSKINKILKRASFFEKLSVFGNRKDFLKSLAQERVGFPLESLLTPENQMTGMSARIPTMFPASLDFPVTPGTYKPEFQIDTTEKGYLPPEESKDFPSFPETTEKGPESVYVRTMQSELIQLSRTLEQNREELNNRKVYISLSDILNLRNIGGQAKSKEDGYWGPLTSKAIDIADDISNKLDVDVYSFMFEKERNSNSAIKNSEIINNLIKHIENLSTKKIDKKPSMFWGTEKGLMESMPEEKEEEMEEPAGSRYTPYDI